MELCDIIKILLDRGADINAKDRDGHRPLELVSAIQPEFISIFRSWSITKQIKISGYKCRKLLDQGEPNSYIKEFDSHGVKPNSFPQEKKSFYKRLKKWWL
jgi:hypothetical protein